MWWSVHRTTGVPVSDGSTIKPMFCAAHIFLWEPCNPLFFTFFFAFHPINFTQCSIVTNMQLLAPAFMCKLKCGTISITLHIWYNANPTTLTSSTGPVQWVQGWANPLLPYHWYLYNKLRWCTLNFQVCYTNVKSLSIYAPMHFMIFMASSANYALLIILLKKHFSSNLS